jgi:A/G-specific adenine glycosylase
MEAPSPRRSPARDVSRAAVDAYRAAIVTWYRAAARDLPWRRDPDPYRVWVSEVMLQQTRVETVIPYYAAFLARFPTVAALAGAREEDVLAAWSGLGYYRRAKLLHAGAKRVAERFGGRFPSAEADVRALPGVGRYTAGAVLSIALGRRAPILDGNVTRVLARVFGVAGDVTRAPTSARLWELAARVVEKGAPGEVNQAQMELGALVCLPANPRCDRCPCRRGCVARREGRVAELPARPARRRAVELRRAVLVVRRGEDVLLRRRREGEISPGLWDLPGAFTGTDADAGIDAARALVPFAVRVGASLGTLRHAVTHRRIRLDVFDAAPAGRAPRRPRGADGADLAWCPPARAGDLALSAPARRILALHPRGPHGDHARRPA